MSRIIIMLQGLTVNGWKVKNDFKIMRGVNYVLNVYFVNNWEDLNKWINQMNISLQVTSQLLMLGDNRTI